jgi:hypothetical protein
MKSSLRHFLMIITAVTLSVSFAQDAETMSKALTTFYQQVAFADAYKIFCDTAAPDLGPTNTQALSTWQAANNVSQIEQLATQFSALSPEMAQAFQTTSAAFQSQFAERFAGQKTEACADLPTLLQGEDSSLTTLYPQEMQLLPSMAAMLGQLDSGQTTSDPSNNPLATDQANNPLATAQPTPQVTTPSTGASGLSGLYNYYNSGYDLDANGMVVPHSPKYWYFFLTGMFTKATSVTKPSIAPTM